MRRVSIFIAVVLFLTAGCATIKEKTRMKNFEKVSQLYQRVMLESDFEAAHEFIDSGAVADETDFTVYNDIKIIEYQVKKGLMSGDNSQVSQTVEVKYYWTDNLVVRTMRYGQLWKYDELEKTWRLKTGLPQFK